MDEILIIPIIVFVLILLSPIIVVFAFKSIRKNLSDKKKLKDVLELNNEKIFFFFADYNGYDFSKHFEERKDDITCIKTGEKWENRTLVKHLTNDFSNKRFPLLVKIEDGKLIKKNHYDSFKHLYKRNNDINAFMDLVDRSIKNLK